MKVGLQRGEDGDESVNVVDANAHLEGKGNSVFAWTVLVAHKSWYMNFCI